METAGQTSMGSKYQEEQEKTHHHDGQEHLRTLQEICLHYHAEALGRAAEKCTLHDTAKLPGRLGYLMLFVDANPRWDEEKIIFVKTNLDLLTAELVNDAVPDVFDDHNDGRQAVVNANQGENEQVPIAAYKQLQYHTGAVFKFDGYYRIVRLEFLQPRSLELIRMLEQKWSLNRVGTKTTKTRHRDGWHASLNMRCAVVKFARDDIASQALEPPSIARIDSSDPRFVRATAPKETKSVNELLKELRMKDLGAGNGDNDTKDCEDLSDHALSHQEEY